MLLAEQLRAAGIPCFPCYDNKNPAVRKGESWREVATRPLDTLQWPSGLVGVPIPPGVVVIDLDTYKGVTREAVEAALGCALPWDAAHVQTTARGGQHYAFRVSWPVRQGTKLLDVVGFDTRVSGKGYICTGEGYTPAGLFGVFALGQPATLPGLPDACRVALEHVPQAAADRVPLPEGDADTATLRAALTHIDPGCGHDDWARVGMALRHQYHADVETGLAMFDAWSAGGFWPAGTPANYDAEDVVKRWGSFKPEGGITVGSLFYAASRQGWQPLAAVDTSEAFNTGAAPADTVTELITRITETAGNPKEIEGLFAAIAATGCSPLQRAILLSTLHNQLKADGELTKALRTQLDAAAGVAAPYQAPPLAEGQVLPPDRPIPPIMWPQGHTRGQHMAPKGTIACFDVLLKAYGVRIEYNIISKKLRVYGANIPEHGTLLDEAALSHMDSLANLNGFPKADVQAMIVAKAVGNEVNPVDDWIRSAPWDGVDRVGELFGCLTLAPEENAVICEVLFRKWIRGAVAIGLGRTRNMEHVLTLVDPHGGEGKTRFFMSLGPPELVKHGVILDLQNKDSIKIATSYWLVELGELDGTFTKSDQAKLKTFLSSEEDEIRLPYGRAYIKYPRRTAYFASVNRPAFLTDDSQNRRYWPIRVRAVNYQHTINMQQVWAQALAEIDAGHIWYLTSAENAAVGDHNEDFRAISRAVDVLSATILEGHEATEHLTVTACLTRAGLHNPSKTDLNEGARWLRNKGYEQIKRSGLRGFLVPEVATSAAEGVGNAFRVIEGGKE